jgi:hypothetical protein
MAQSIGWAGWATHWMTEGVVHLLQKVGSLLYSVKKALWRVQCLIKWVSGGHSPGV